MPAAGWSQVDSGQDKAIPPSKVERLNRAPVSKEILKVTLPRPVETTLPNGIHVMILEDHRFPLVAVEFDIDGAGQMYEPANLPGLAVTTARMLDQGTKTRTSKQIAEQIDSLGASSFRFRGVRSPVRRRFPHRDFPIRSTNGSRWPPTSCCIPVFRPTNWRSTSPRAKPALLQQRSQPGFLALQTMSRALYGTYPGSRRVLHSGIAGRADARIARELA